MKDTDSEQAERQKEIDALKRQYELIDEYSGNYVTVDVLKIIEE